MSLEPQYVSSLQIWEPYFLCSPEEIRYPNFSGAAHEDKLFISANVTRTRTPATEPLRGVTSGSPWTIFSIQIAWLLAHVSPI